jgi:hypothetical protein
VLAGAKFDHVTLDPPPGQSQTPTSNPDSMHPKPHTPRPKLYARDPPPQTLTVAQPPQPSQSSQARQLRQLLG